MLTPRSYSERVRNMAAETQRERSQSCTARSFSHMLSVVTMERKMVVGNVKIDR